MQMNQQNTLNGGSASQATQGYYQPAQHGTYTGFQRPQTYNYQSGNQNTQSGYGSYQTPNTTYTPRQYSKPQYNQNGTTYYNAQQATAFYNQQPPQPLFDFTTAMPNFQLAAERATNQTVISHHYGDPQYIDTTFQTLSDQQDLSDRFEKLNVDYGTYDYSNSNNNNSNNTNSSNYTNGSKVNAVELEQYKQYEQALFEAHHMRQGIDFDKYEDIPVSATGNDVPKHAESFLELHLCQILYNNVEKSKYVKPTPIQKYAIPVSLAGRDVMACAQTGSGKTAAYLLPIVNSLILAKQKENQREPVPQGELGIVTRPKAVVLAPTRELAGQINQYVLKFVHSTPIKTVVCYGGAAIDVQIRNLQRRKPEIVVACPGRLIDLIKRGHIELNEVEFLVLDEADRMLEMGFEEQVREIISQHGMPSHVPSGSGKRRQASMFSATFPVAIQELAASFLHDYVFLTVGRVGETTKLITQRVVYFEEASERTGAKKIRLLQELNDIAGLTLIFVETKRAADLLHRELYSFNVACACIHGGKTQQQREKALSEFKNQQVSVLIATDVAARGLDIPNVEHVINFDMANDIEGYIHRIGRTGRAGNKGIATTFFSEKHRRLASDLVEKLREAEQEVPDFLMQLKQRPSYGAGNNYNNYRSNNYGGKFGGRDFRNNGNSNNFANNAGSNFNQYANTGYHSGNGTLPTGNFMPAQNGQRNYYQNRAQF